MALVQLQPKRQQQKKKKNVMKQDFSRYVDLPLVLCFSLVFKCNVVIVIGSL